MVKLLIISVLSCATAAACVTGAASFYNRYITKEAVEFQSTDKVLDNPMVGFAAVADYEKLAETTPLVYLPVYWSEFEPEEGKYDFEYINEEYNLEKWRSMGKRVVLRFVCDKPRDEAHMDIPEWLYEKTADGTFYDCSYGKGYSPDYGNEVFIEYHRKAIEALGREYGKDSFVTYVELGSLGHWGEWHVKYSAGIKPLPSAEVCAQYIEPYIDAFPNAKLMMRRPYTYVSDNGFGVYNDMAGSSESTEEWLSWINEGGAYEVQGNKLPYTPYPNIWEDAPVGGEFTSSIPMEELLGGSLEETISLLKQTHMSFIGPKIPNIDERAANSEAVDEILKNIGYRYGISKACFTHNAKTGKLYMKLTVNNYGVAPMYYDWPLCVYICDAYGNILEKQVTDVKLSELACDGQNITTALTVDCKKLGIEGMPSVAVAIEDPDTGKPAVELDMECSHVEDRIYFLR
ncbi:MAG: DUF4832 domain-containing protein [Lachnospiraceae bacterium]|nr:DUF4832 domain-containing protein [Lachnospiraceae bacterium]